ncbi:hypothetical protein VNO78_03944 [Psophocarpus tetragonolobus]|uniref:Uncharacterized protein n=1 Tax=Psophocarpus tetragonolobus TaxID=3891 RepID=A0AAN9T326_PSOTE
MSWSWDYLFLALVKCMLLGLQHYCVVSKVPSFWSFGWFNGFDYMLGCVYGVCGGGVWWLNILPEGCFVAGSNLGGS